MRTYGTQPLYIGPCIEEPKTQTKSPKPTPSTFLFLILACRSLFQLGEDDDPDLVERNTETVAAFACVGGRNLTGLWGLAKLFWDLGPIILNPQTSNLNPKP